MASVSLVTAMSRAVTVRKKLLPGTTQPLQSVGNYGSGGWWPIIHEPFTGAWQRNISYSAQDVVTFPAVWACATLIASDIAKLWLRLVQKDANGIWTETDSPSFSPVLRKPNRYSTRIKFIEHWILSKLLRGNTYVLKQRDNRNVVVALYILDPGRVKPLVAPDGSVFYQLYQDQLSGVDVDQVIVPASEIIHDINVPLYHPLVGVSAIHACGLAAMQGLRIQNNSEAFFANHSQPGGILSAPTSISEDAATAIQTRWEQQFTGENAGRVAVIGDGMTYHPLTVDAHDAQLVEQLKWTGESVCTAFHVPAWKVGLAPMPAYGNVQAANIEYYAQALQNPIESIEACLDEGLGLGTGENRNLGVEFDLEALLRMDTGMQMEIASKGVGAAIFTPNEGRASFGKKPVDGGDTPYLQEQNWPIKLLSERALPPERPPTAPEPVPAPAPPEPKGGEKHMTSLELENAATVEFEKAMAIAA